MAVAINQLSLNIDSIKKCSRCLEFLPTFNFGKKTASKDGLRGTCKNCRKGETSRKEYLKIWRSKNKELKSKLDKEYREKNKEKITAYKRTEKYKQTKAKSDKKYYLKTKDNQSILMARKLRSMISARLQKRKGRNIDVLGYSVEDMVNHFQSLFKEGMSWNNYGRGGWQVDHIRPISSFDFNQENWIKECFALSNLQPLFESENSSKGSFYNGKRHFMQTY